MPEHEPVRPPGQRTTLLRDEATVAGRFLLILAAVGGVADLLTRLRERGMAIPDLSSSLPGEGQKILGDVGSAAFTGVGAVSSFATILGLIAFVTVFALLGGDKLAATRKGRSRQSGRSPDSPEGDRFGCCRSPREHDT